jgi:hypothetical protein
MRKCGAAGRPVCKDDVSVRSRQNQGEIEHIETCFEYCAAPIDLLLSLGAG